MNTEFASLVRAFRKSGKPWAVTGSWAVKLHAEKAGLQPHRTPRDFDFAVKDMKTFIGILLEHGYRFGDRGPPLITPNRTPEKVTMHKDHFEVDLLRAGSRLAPSLYGVEMYKGVPLVPVKNMMQLKRNILWTLNNKKARENLNFLNVIQGW
jgi:hypothetical protein